MSACGNPPGLLSPQSKYCLAASAVTDVTAFDDSTPDATEIAMRVVDGTNMAEMSFGEIEKPISANGGYNETKWHGLLMNKIGRINERRRVEYHNITGPGHYDLAAAREHNALMLAHGLPPPHAHLQQLVPRSQALYGIHYFHAELARRAPPPRAASSSTRKS